MAEVRAGEVRTLAVLFDRHQPALLRYALRMTGNRAWSEDLVQEIFVRLLKSRHQYRDGHSFQTWVYRIARNAFIDQTRRRRFEVATAEPMEVPVPPSVSSNERENLELLRAALARLPEPQREILTLAKFQQLPYEQIAGILDIEVNTVKTRVHRAIRNLRDIYFELSGRPHVQSA